nr:helix-turn-helix transcriptional regulator [Pseudomaricurvus sp. HS19]
MTEEPTKAVVEGRLRSFGAELLTEREQDVAQLMLRGCKTTEIANLLGITESTIKVHRKHLYAKLQINSQAELFGLFMDEFQGV